MSEYAGRDRYRTLPAVVPAATLMSLHPSDPVVPPSVPWGPDAGGAEAGDGD